MTDADAPDPDALEIDVLAEDVRWSDLQGWADRAVPATLAAAGLSGTCGVSILGCDDDRIAVLNADFRDKPTPTNVLSWPSEDRRPGQVPTDPELGDIAIAYDTCAREAAEQGKTLEAHVIHLLVHATLHLLGHDHIDAGDAETMEALEVRIVTGLGFSDPYLSDMQETPG